jgi:hypothetical protein
MASEPPAPGEPLRPSERGLLADLAAAGVMTTEQVARLRFPGTGRANCRLHLAALLRRGLLARLRGAGTRETCWSVTAAGMRAIGRPAGDAPRGLLDDPWRLDDMLKHSEHFLRAALAQRARETVEALGGGHAPPPPADPGQGGPGRASRVSDR